MDVLLIKGLIIGLIFGVPAGAIGALSIQRTLEKGFWNGFLTGLGSSAADALYACLGVFGITMITDFLQRHEKPIGIIGSVVIAVYGVSILRKKERPKTGSVAGAGNGLSGFFSAFFIAIMNPATILSFFVAFSAFGIVGDYSILQGLGLVLGVVLGTGIWWGILNGAVHCFKKKINDKAYHEQLGRIACCSAYHYQRMFTYMAGITLAEYIRRRKMSLAAVDLQGGEERIPVQKQAVNLKNIPFLRPLGQSFLERVQTSPYRNWSSGS